MDCTRCLTLWIGRGVCFCFNVDSIFWGNQVNGKENKASLQELDLGCST